MTADLTDASESGSSAAAVQDDFEPGELLNAAHDLARLDGHVPRDSDESDAAYLARVVRAGKAVTIASAEIAGPDGVTALKQAMARATAERVPLIMVSGVRIDPTANLPTAAEWETAKSAALAAARRRPE